LLNLLKTQIFRVRFTKSVNVQQGSHLRRMWEYSITRRNYTS